MSPKEKIFLTDIYLRTLQSVHPDALFSKYLHLYESNLYYRNTRINCHPSGRLILAGSGKASLTMAEALLNFLPKKPDKTLLISPFQNTTSHFDVYRGNHPVPAAESINAGKQMLALLDSLHEEDLLLYVLSGGSSSLFEYPVDGISIDDIQKATQVFLAQGLSIGEINFLRAGLSQVKAGKLAERCKANCQVFVLSDVMGNDISVIGSGPFSAQKSPSYTADTLINKYHLDSFLESHMIHRLRKNISLQSEKHIPHYIIGSNIDILESAAGILEESGIKTISFPESLFGEADDAGLMIANMLTNYTGSRPICMLFGGETTVTLSTGYGKGGRAQETALSTLNKLKNTPGITLLCASSDGIDGYTDAAGAIVDAATYQIAKANGISLEDYLLKHDSYFFHQQCGSLIKTGYSGTNVGDIVMALINK